MQESSVEEKQKNNESSMNYQVKYEKYKDCYYVYEKLGSIQVKQLMSQKTRKGIIPEFQNQFIYLKESLQDHNICSRLILTGYKKNLLQGILNSSKRYILKIFQDKTIKIGLYILLQLGLLKNR